MRVANRLLREASYNRRSISRNQLDYGGFYHIQYTDTTSDKQPDRYFIFVIQPDVKGKVHCLDLELIEEQVFDDFFKKIRLEDDVQVAIRKAQSKGYVKSNIRIGPRFYQTFIKSNEDLLTHHPYKTLELKRINNVRYIEYDVN